MQLVSLIAIHRIVVYPVNSAVQISGFYHAMKAKTSMINIFRVYFVIHTPEYGQANGR